MSCIHCNARHRGRSEELYFVNSETALQCRSPEEPPAWFTERYKPCHPFQLGNKLMHGTMEPYFDILFYNDDYAPRPRYDERATDLWRPVALQDLVDKLFDYGGYSVLYKPERIKRAIRRATNASYIDIFDCVNKNQNKFNPELWDHMLRIRNLDRYLPSRELYYHQTQEEIDEEAGALRAAHEADNQDSEQEGHGQEVAM